MDCWMDERGTRRSVAFAGAWEGVSSGRVAIDMAVPADHVKALEWMGG
jgi:hypothetical protein